MKMLGVGRKDAYNSVRFADSGLRGGKMDPAEKPLSDLTGESGETLCEEKN